MAVLSWWSDLSGSRICQKEGSLYRLALVLSFTVYAECGTCSRLGEQSLTHGNTTWFGGGLLYSELIPMRGRVTTARGNVRKGVGTEGKQIIVRYIVDWSSC